MNVTAYDVWNEYAAEFVAMRKNKLHISPLITADYENNKKHRIKNKMTKPSIKANLMSVWIRVTPHDCIRVCFLISSAFEYMLKDNHAH